jgi:hypothetical protein
MPNRLPVLPPPPKISEVSAELSDLLVDRPICRTADLKSIRLQSVSIGSGWNNELPPPPPLLRAPMRTCHAQSIGGSGDAAHLRLRLTTRSPLEMQARLQRPPFPPLLLRQARFARQALSRYLWHQFSAFGVLIYLHTPMQDRAIWCWSGSKMRADYSACWHKMSSGRYLRNDAPCRLVHRFDIRNENSDLT